MKNSSAISPVPGKPQSEIEVVSIIIAASTTTITIPIPSDAPLRCRDLDELRSIAVQMESLIRLLVNAGDANPPIAHAARTDEKNAIAVW